MKHLKELEEIEITFYDFRNKQTRLLFKTQDMDVKKMTAFDEEYWEEVN